MIKWSAIQLAYGPRLLFQSKAMQFSAGELVCIMGLNGKGKSSLLKAISGELMLSEGRIESFVQEQWRSIQSLSLEEKAKQLACVWTESPRFGFLSVAELLQMGRAPYVNWRMQLMPLDKQAIEEGIDACGIRHLLGRACNELSDGEMQLCLLAKCLIQDCPIMLLDEPSAFLDNRNCLLLFDLLKKMCQQKNKLILLSSHHHHWCFQYADRILLVENDELIELDKNDWKLERLL